MINQRLQLFVGQLQNFLIVLKKPRLVFWCNLTINFSQPQLKLKTQNLIIKQLSYLIQQMKPAALGNPVEKRGERGSDFECSEIQENESSYVNSECIKKEKKEKLKLRKQRIYKKKCHGLWTLEEEGLFVAYMKEFRSIFQDKELRRAERIFKKMSRFLKTRSPDQCRSHHQKYEIRFGDYEGIVNYIESKLLEDHQSVCDPEVKLEKGQSGEPKNLEKQSFSKKTVKISHPSCDQQCMVKNINLNKKLSQIPKLKKGGNEGVYERQNFPISLDIQNWISVCQNKNLGNSIKMEDGFILENLQHKIHEKDAFGEAKENKVGIATAGNSYSKTREVHCAELMENGFRALEKEQRGVDAYQHEQKPYIVLLLSFEEFFDDQGA